MRFSLYEQLSWAKSAIETKTRFQSDRVDTVVYSTTIYVDYLRFVRRYTLRSVSWFSRFSTICRCIPINNYVVLTFDVSSLR